MGARHVGRFMRVTVHYVVETKLAHFAVVWAQLIATVYLSVIDPALSIRTLAVDQLPIISFFA